MLPEQEKKAKTVKLSDPIGFGADMISEVTPKSPTLANLKKYEVESLTDNEYMQSPSGVMAISYAMLPDVADEYKEQLTFFDGIKIIEMLSDFI